MAYQSHIYYDKARRASAPGRQHRRWLLHFSILSELSNGFTSTLIIALTLMLNSAFTHNEKTT
jgi:hypothetical protein